MSYNLIKYPSLACGVPVEKAMISVLCRCLSYLLTLFWFRAPLVTDFALSTKVIIGILCMWPPVIMNYARSISLNGLSVNYRIFFFCDNIFLFKLLNMWNDIFSTQAYFILMIAIAESFKKCIYTIQVATKLIINYNSSNRL